jgi:hypothetical protein
MELKCAARTNKMQYLESVMHTVAWWHAPNSLKDPNVNPKQKTSEKQGVGARSVAHYTLEG